MRRMLRRYGREVWFRGFMRSLEGKPLVIRPLAERVYAAPQAERERDFSNKLTLHLSQPRWHPL